MKQYLAGASMGYAKPAELNRFPGPMHVLELADRLALSTSQRSATKALMDAHKAEARTIGARLVEAERRLEHLFRSGNFAPEVLETHRRMRALLTEEQVRRYAELRGY